MFVNQDSMKPIYIQISEWLETEILNGNFKQDEKVFSQYQLADMLTINPATAAKGLQLLAEEGVLYKKRGLGMFVSADAKIIIRNRRKNQNLKQLISKLVLEAKHLDLSEEELLGLIIAEQRRLRGDDQ